MSLSFGRTVQVNRNGLLTLAILLSVIIFLFYGFGYSDNLSLGFGTKSRKQLNEFVNLKDLLSASIDAAQRGGVLVYDIRENALLKEKSKGKTLEGANDPVTDGDMKSHIEMYNALRNAFPRITIISEEKSSHKLDGSHISSADLNSLELETLNLDDEFVKTEDVQVWIDPLDATQEYTENLREYVTTMVCVAVKGVPTIGVIHKPFEKFTAWAWVDRAHNTKLKVNEVEKPTPDDPVKVIVSRSHKGTVIEKAQKAFGKNVVVTPAGGAGFKTLEVVVGHQDVYFHSTLIKKWDICAGDAILKHFKGHMTTLEGLDINYSDPSDYKNPKGLVASLNHHPFYLAKLQNS